MLSLTHSLLGSPCACICGCVLCCAVLCNDCCDVLCGSVVIMSFTHSFFCELQRTHSNCAVCVCAVYVCECVYARHRHAYILTNNTLSQSLMDIMFRRAYARDAHHTRRCSSAYVCTSVDMCMQWCVFVSILLSLISTLLLSTQFRYVYEWFCTNSHRHADIRTHIHTHRRAHVEPYWKQNTKPLTLNMSR